MASSTSMLAAAFTSSEPLMLGTQAAFKSSEPLMLGTEAEDDVTARGDATNEFSEAVATYGAYQAFRFGCVKLHACADASPLPVSAKITVTNTGEIPWPPTTILVIVNGGALGLP